MEYTSFKQFWAAYGSFRHPPNPEQLAAVCAERDDSLFVVAGPGTGKTTVLTLRILKLILVDGVPPTGILATTFTKKAAAELRSRILSWGYQIIEHLQASKETAADQLAFLESIDINQVITGTIDSVCERALRDHREPGKQPPILVDEFASTTLMLRSGLLDGGRYLDTDLDAFFLNLHGGTRFGFHLGRKNGLAQSIWDRRHHDLVNWDQFKSTGPASEQQAKTVLDDVILAYKTELADREMVDFSTLEHEVLTRLQAGELKTFTDPIQVVLVDEYQDTNLLQESLYFELAKICSGALTVVGDDDQSLYRFRGATVELFSDYEARYQTQFGTAPTKVFLKTNYRSTKKIVAFVNQFATLDPTYQQARVQSKPPLDASPYVPEGIPPLGMFRSDLDTLASDLAKFIHDVFRGGGYQLPDGETIRCKPAGDDGPNGDLGDCSLLCSSPAETNAGNNPRLPQLLRSELGGMSPAIQVFNPRGQDMHLIPIIQVFGGLIAEALDPGGVIESQTSGITQQISQVLFEWRTEAINFLNGSPPSGLADYAVAWANRDPSRNGYHWPKSVPILELLYGLLHYFPELHDDPEGQVYLEVFTRQASACELIGSFKGQVVTDPSNSGLSDASVKELMRYLLAPIASGSVSVDEELIGLFPRDRLNILSIHQSKGLEFPLTIVDIGSDFKTNHRAHAFKRFPSDGGPPHRMEDLLRPHTALNAPIRSSVDRAFDDLYRQFFVAFSRPEQVLLLVGLDRGAPSGSIANVAAGYQRDGTSAWSTNSPILAI